MLNTIEYRPSIKKGSNHYLSINGEGITTTIAKEVLKFAETRINDRYTWKQLKDAIRTGQPLLIIGGS